MFQFPPVAPGLSKPSLYEAAVRLAMNENLPNVNYKIGAQVFTKFRLVILDGQARATPEFNAWLAQLRDTSVEHPVTDEWLDKLTELSREDFKNDNIDWQDSTMVVSGNAERYAFFRERIKTFGLKRKQPILSWNCPVYVGKGVYEVPDYDAEKVHGSQKVYFARGAKCILTKSLETTLGLGKGSTGILLDAVWEDETLAVDIDALQPGSITEVSQPDFLVIKVFINRDEFTNVCIRPKSRTFEYEGKERRYKGHECDLAFAVTYHKVQAKTLDSII